MGLKVYNGSSWSNQASAFNIYGVNGAFWTPVTRAYVYDGSPLQWRQFYPEAPANTAAPTITLSSGSVYPAGINQTLTASTGTWTNNPTSYSYQWYARGNGIGYSAISGATSSSFALSGTYAGATIKVTVTATNARGSTAADSAEVGAFGPGALTGLTASKTGTGTVFVSWNSSNGADRYYVQSSPPFAETRTTSTSITITGLTGPSASFYVAAETTKWGWSFGYQGSGASTSVSGLP